MDSNTDDPREPSELVQSVKKLHLLMQLMSHALEFIAQMLDPGVKSSVEISAKSLLLEKNGEEVNYMYYIMKTEDGLMLHSDSKLLMNKISNLIDQHCSELKKQEATKH